MSLWIGAQRVSESFWFSTSSLKHSQSALIAFSNNHKVSICCKPTMKASCYTVIDSIPLSTACISLSTLSSLRRGEIKNWANLCIVWEQENITCKSFIESLPKAYMYIQLLKLTFEIFTTFWQPSDQLHSLWFNQWERRRWSLQYFTSCCLL